MVSGCDRIMNFVRVQILLYNELNRLQKSSQAY